MYEFTTTRRVEFADTDMAGLCHFARFIVFMETAEHQFLNALGTSVTAKHDGRQLGWPRVSVAVQFKSPARFGDLLEIRMRVARKGESSMTYDFVFTRDGREIATGKMTSVCCVVEPGEPVRSIPIPDSVASQIEEPP